MADKKLSELPVAGSLGPGALFLVTQGSTSSAATLSQLAAAVGATFGDLALKNTIAVPADISAGGTPGETTFLRGDGTWAVPAGGGGGGGIPEAPETGVSFARKDAAWSALHAVATSGDYDDLSGTPSIPPPQVPADWDATTGVSRILNKPSIPPTPVNADWNSGSGLSQILNKPTIPPAQVNSDWNAVSGVAQILNKPSIPSAQVSADWNSSTSPTNILNKPSTMSQNEAETGTSTTVRMVTSQRMRQGVAAYAYSKSYIDGQLGDIETALDTILGE